MKNKFINKKISVILSLILVLTASSCDDLLEKEPITDLGEEQGLQVEDDYINLVNGMYDVLQWQVTEGNTTHMYPFMWQDIRADNLISQWAYFWPAGIPLDDFNDINANNTSITTLWTKWYTAVARANTAIYFVEEFDGFSSEELKNRLIAEAKFIRAFAYFELVKMWGDVPVIVDYIESAADDLKFPRTPKEEIYDQVIEVDLEEAIADLPLKSEYSAGDMGRATKGAAYTLLAKAHLYQEEYDKVIEYTNAVINSGEYSLEPNFADNFSVDNEHGVESIFEIGYADGYSNFNFEGSDGQTNQGSSTHQMFGYLFNQVPATGDYSYIINSSYGNAVPRKELIDFFDDADTRKDATFITPETVLDGLPLSCNCYEGRDADGNPIFGGDGLLAYVNTDTYFYFWEREEALESRASCRKFALSPSVHLNLLNFGSSPLNEKVFRYADVLLMHAEASLEAGGGNGQDALDQVRTRAGLESVAISLQNVKDERRRELATEGWDRFTDLVRWGDAADALAFKNFTPGRDEYLPIPQAEIDIVGADILSQNDGY